MPRRNATLPCPPWHPGAHTTAAPEGRPVNPQDLRTRPARVGENLVVLGDLAVPLNGDKLQVESSGSMFGAVEPDPAAPLPERAGAGAGAGAGAQALLEDEPAHKVSEMLDEHVVVRPVRFREVSRNP